MPAHNPNRGVFSIPFGRGNRREIRETLPESGSKPRESRYFRPEELAAGALAHLTGAPKHALPEDLVGVMIDCSGARPMLIEHTRQGYRPRHEITEETQYLDIRLPDGHEVCIEVRLMDVWVAPSDDEIVFDAASLVVFDEEEHRDE